jgi:chromosome segregation ATPase
MDAAAHSSEQDEKPAYTTSKQVQAWFLRRSRDLWKTKYADLKIELKRVQQRVADIDRSRAQWRRRAEDAGQQLEALQAENARLHAAADAATDRGGGKRPLCLPSLTIRRSTFAPPATATPAG